jgi:hypothetical protein
MVETTVKLSTIPVTAMVVSFISKASHFLGSVGCFDKNVAYSVTSSRKVRCENVETMKTPSKIQAPRIYQTACSTYTVDCSTKYERTATKLFESKIE